MQEYKTKQKEILIECLNSNRDIHMTAADISDHLKAVGHPLGMSTVYRQLDKLVSAGLVRKFIVGDNSSACYQFIGDKGECCEHFHLKCSVCGKLIHTDCTLMKQIAVHMKEHHNFEVDPGKIMLYGTCGECMSKQNVNGEEQ